MRTKRYSPRHRTLATNARKTRVLRYSKPHSFVKKSCFFIVAEEKFYLHAMPFCLLLFERPRNLQITSFPRRCTQVWFAKNNDFLQGVFRITFPPFWQPTARCRQPDYARALWRPTHWPHSPGATFCKGPNQYSEENAHALQIFRPFLSPLFAKIRLFLSLSCFLCSSGVAPARTRYLHNI